MIDKIRITRKLGLLIKVEKKEQDNYSKGGILLPQYHAPSYTLAVVCKKGSEVVDIEIGDMVLLDRIHRTPLHEDSEQEFFFVDYDEVIGVV